MSVQYATIYRVLEESAVVCQRMWYLPVHLAVLCGCFSEESKLLIQLLGWIPWSARIFSRAKCHFWHFSSVVSGKKKVLKYFWICCCTHGGAQAIVHVVSCWAVRVLKSRASTQASDQNVFLLLPFILMLFPNLISPSLCSAHWFSTSLPGPFEVTQCLTLLSFKIMKRTC